MLKKLLKIFTLLFILGALTITLAAAATWWYLEPGLPEIDVLKDVRFQVPLRVYTEDGLLLAEYGEKRRIPVTYDEIPEQMVHAILASEDDRFFEHPGVDWQGIARAAYVLLKTGQKGQGGSTITMQVARNFFLSFEKTYLRKLNEIILSFKIEQELSKQEILSLYLNKIYLGQRAYGIGAAAVIYYDRPLAELNLPQIAMLAGLPKAPSAYNPITDPVKGVQRRNYVLRRMLELNYINAEEYKEATNADVSARLHKQNIDIDVPYIGEMVRAHMYETYGEEAYTDGYSVYTTINSRLQRSAQRAVRDNLLSYTERHGYKGALSHIEITANDSFEKWDDALSEHQQVAGLRPALITQINKDSITAYQAGMGKFEISREDLLWARKYINENRRGPELKEITDAFATGDIVYVTLTEEGIWHLTQLPDAEGALVSLNPDTGAIIALSGGFDFNKSKFNRAVQARRQPGSNFKPFVYSAALDAGFTAASMINDAPVVFDDPGLEASWRPENYSGKFYGPTRLRKGLIHSRNLISIRLLREVGIHNALKYIKRFGFDTSRFPTDLSLALGSVSLSPLEVVSGYAVFANGGFKVTPYFISRILDSRHNLIFEEIPETACLICETLTDQNLEDPKNAELLTSLPQKKAPRVITPQNDWIMTSMLKDVIKHGTGRRALKLGRGDLAGKTGTTNDQKDAWFSGFNSSVVTSAWVGFDDLKPLGVRDTGGRAALPMWISYMKDALEGVAEKVLPVPENIITIRIDPDTGKRVSANFPGAIFETFRIQYAPEENISTATQTDQQENLLEIDSEELF